MQIDVGWRLADILKHLDGLAQVAYKCLSDSLRLSLVIYELLRIFERKNIP